MTREERTVQEFELYTSSDNPNRYVYRIVLDIDNLKQNTMEKS